MKTKAQKKGFLTLTIFLIWMITLVVFCLLSNAFANA